MFELEDRPAARAPSKPLSGLSFGISVAVHVAVLGVLLLVTKVFTRPPETVIPIDMTIVPPWAEQTDDPEPDPNPPPKPEPPKPKPKPQPRPEPKPEPVKNVEAVEKVVEKKKPPEKKPPEKLNLRDKAKLVKDSPKPPEKLDLRDKAKKVDAPKLPPGKATAAEKPLSPEEIRKLLEQGYTYGSRNQLATSEAQRCVSIIAQAIRREWDKESFKWYPGLSPIQVMLQFGPGGSIRGFRIVSGSGDPDVDRTAQNALRRLGRIPGLSSSFLEQFAEIAIEMKPVAGG